MLRPCRALLLLVPASLLIGACESAPPTGTGGQSASSLCEPGQYFAYSDRACGRHGAEGTCEPTSGDACLPGQAVCGCDGKVYPTPCDARAAGVDTTRADECPSPAGMFACGDSYCAKASEYCEAWYGRNDDDTGCETTQACLPFPDTCPSAPTCACIDDWQGNTGCYEDPNGGFFWSNGDCDL